MIMPPDTIATARLVLRRPRLSDAPAMFEYASDPEVTRYMDWPTHTALSDTTEFLQSCPRRWDSGEEFSWVLTVKLDDVALGTIGCRVRGPAAEIGYVLHPRHWRQGYVTEAARAVMAWAFSVEAISSVSATCDAENLASARVLQKLGMRREDVLRHWKPRPNLSPEPRETFVYTSSRSEYRMSNST